jgi:hypothetical protein
MLVIGYGIFALIALILLIVFNVRADSSRSQPVKENAREPKPAEPEVPLMEEGPSETQDQRYRNSLRQWIPVQKMEEASPPKKENSTSDAEYRNAMRNLRKPADREDT